MEPSTGAVEHDVVDVGFQPFGCSAPSFIHQCVGRLHHGRSGFLGGARSASDTASGNDVGVAVNHLYAVNRDAGAVGGEHGPRRVMALSVGRRSGANQKGGVGAEFDGAVLAAGNTGGAVDEHGDADADQVRVVPLTAGRLVSPEVVVADGVEG